MSGFIVATESPPIFARHIHIDYSGAETPDSVGAQQDLLRVPAGFGVVKGAPKGHCFHKEKRELP